METYNPHKNPHVPKPLETLATNMILYIFMIIYGNVYGEMLMNKALGTLQTNPYPTDA